MDHLDPSSISMEATSYNKAIVTARDRIYFSHHHIYAAFHFAKLSAKSEEAFNKELSNTSHDRSKIFDMFFYEHRAYVTGAIFTSVAYLEAIINELFADTVDYSDSAVARQLDLSVKSQMATLWKIEIPGKGIKSLVEKFSTLEKFQVALKIAQKEPFEKGKTPYQDVNHIIDIRNTLVHYKPEWITIHSSNNDEFPVLEKKWTALEQERKFSNPLFGGGNAFFPDRCLCYECAKWAATSSLNFVDDFFRKMELDPSPAFEHLRTQLNNLLV
jgi:hypothetical protein